MAYQNRTYDSAVIITTNHDLLKGDYVFCFGMTFEDSVEEKWWITLKIV
ncbi:hypothetical protein [Methanoplanus limicola]|uniref:Uncharacterized protein n=1 Tax=Methanoplanus limicola DSM 2279 TaxID=937775 RepID=H1Z021_9EURY|nr:hypothetical protein [Methanoplanus limicola]EHQ35228.1 hypothetical protein Metlim_1117 [Methanoplanus limicola DSM 2279]